MIGKLVDRSHTLGVAALAAVCLVVPTACGSPHDAEAGASALSVSTGAGAAAKPKGDPTQAPDFALVDMEGNEVRLSDSAGRIRLVDFWATWCAPCREEIPMLKDLNARYRDKGLEILAISDSTDSPSAVKDFAARFGIDYTNLLGTDQVAQEYLVLGLPTAFLIDREGRVIERFTGPKPPEILEERIQELLSS